MARLALLWLPLPEVTSPQVVGCVHILATDVWSQIRKDAAVAVGRVLPALPWSTVEAVLHDLLQVCKQPPDEGDDDWKGREGAFRVLASMLAQFKKNTTPPSTGFSLGTRMMQYLPSALLCDLKPVSDVAAQLVPHIPLPFLTKHWQVVFPTCEKYVMHVATTSIDAIPLLASILESLALPCSQHPDANQREFFWQRMEGRLMGIDSLVHVLGVNKLTSISSQLLAPPTKPAPKAFQSFQHTLAYVEAGALLLLFQSATAMDTKTQPANALLLQAVLNVLWASHARPPLTNVWNLHDITTAAAPFLLHPTVPLRLFAKAVFNEWDDDSGQTAAAAPTTDGKAVCFQAFWTSFDAPSASGGRLSDLVTGTCTPDELLTLET
ncbi:hypothetical protein DYB36_005541 [Aphanomyces astaci]|uniref:DUF3730 domain-containing protein n=1 Tax=Aphanomyces astaci TaxID=112090 RepID=A0A397AU69_APHAT|nr:hypothetical protein DYB36_005541 [Aphanomyces astaci]